jgi:hypothetical protein
MFTVRTCKASGGRPVSTTPGWFGTTSILRAGGRSGTASNPGSLEVSWKGRTSAIDRERRQDARVATSPWAD